MKGSRWLGVCLLLLPLLLSPPPNSLYSGTYEVQATPTDAAGNVGTDATSNELVIAP